jgi:ABC-type dipeptide/oligopeptide/nickel transport system permease subunit
MTSSRSRSFASRFVRRCSSNPTSMFALAFVIILVVVALFAPMLAPYDPVRPDFRRIAQPPTAEHWLGTDQNGRDILSRVIHGTRISVTIGVAAVLLGLVVGTTMGLVAGYFGGWVDSLLMRTVDVLLAFPGILLAILIISIFGSSVTNIVIALAVFSVPTFARVSRGSALTLRTLDYVQAGRAVGGSPARVLLRHVLPNAWAPVVVYGTLRCATAILGGAALSFLGLGVSPPTPEWGLMVSQGREIMRSAPHVMLFPGLAIFLTVLAVNLLGDVLRDVMDPKTRT